MTPESKARRQIDQTLEQAGWVIQDMKQLNLAAGMGVAVREYSTDTGPADYLLFVNRNAVGVIEDKKDSTGENLTTAENQTERYATANLKWRKDNTPLRFLFQTHSRHWPKSPERWPDSQRNGGRLHVSSSGRFQRNTHSAVGKVLERLRAQGYLERTPDGTWIPVRLFFERIMARQAVQAGVPAVDTDMRV